LVVERIAANNIAGDVVGRNSYNSSEESSKDEEVHVN
jgi:hypothetical protein